MNKVNILSVLVIVTIALSGCYSLRKKFVRKNKSNTTPPVYVDFKDYPQDNPENLYDNYYLFVGAWMDEIVEGLNNGYNYKRQQHAFSEVVHNLDRINGIFTEEGKNKLKPIYDEMVSLNNKVSPNLTDIDRNFILRRVEIIRLRFSRKFRHSKVSRWIRKN